MKISPARKFMIGFGVGLPLMFGGMVHIEDYIYENPPRIGPIEQIVENIGEYRYEHKFDNTPLEFLSTFGDRSHVVVSDSKYTYWSRIGDSLEATSEYKQQHSDLYKRKFNFLLHMMPVIMGMCTMLYGAISAAEDTNKKYRE